MRICQRRRKKAEKNKNGRLLMCPATDGSSWSSVLKHQVEKDDEPANPYWWDIPEDRSFIYNIKDWVEDGLDQKQDNQYCCAAQQEYKRNGNTNKQTSRNRYTNQDIDMSLHFPQLLSLFGDALVLVCIIGERSKRSMD